MTEREELAEIDALAKIIWLAQFHRAFDREPTDPWENQGEAVMAPCVNTAVKVLSAGYSRTPAVTDEMVEAGRKEAQYYWPISSSIMRVILTAALAAKSSPAPSDEGLPTAADVRGILADAKSSPAPARSSLSSEESDPVVMPDYGAGETIDPESGEYLPPGHDGTDPKDYAENDNRARDIMVDILRGDGWNISGRGCQEFDSAFKHAIRALLPKG